MSQISKIKLLCLFIILSILNYVLSPANASPYKALGLKDLESAEYKIAGIGEDSGLQSFYLNEYNKTHPKNDPTEKLYLCAYAFGDLNGDGLGDAVAVIALNTGGTGNFTYLTALINDHGKANCVDQLTLGDRSMCKSLKIKHRIVTCDMMTHAPGDGACFPSLRRVLTYKLIKNKLVGPHDVQ